MPRSVWLLLAATCFVLLAIGSEVLAAEEKKCEVCETFLTNFASTLTDDERKSKDKVEAKLKKACKDATGKEERFCFYIGAREDSATYTVGDVSKPLTYFLPADKICERIGAKDSAICALKYDKQVDLSEVDFKKLKVKDLKKFLSDWGETCSGCSEKSEFIKKIEELLPKHAPEVVAKRKKNEL